MNRNFKSYTKPYDQAIQQEASSRETDLPVWVAIGLTSGQGRTTEQVWEDPKPAEHDHVCMMLNEWAINGDIDAGTYNWGCEKIEVAGE